MKKLIKSMLTLSLILVSALVCLKVNAFEPISGEVRVGESVYNQGDVVETNYLEGKLVHNKYIGYSSSGLTGFNAAGSGGGGLNVPNQLYPQSVNVLSIPSDTPAKIVNWTYQTNYGWALATVEQIAKNFENHNPGWKVIAAINADFFDINSKKPLPLTTSGVFSSNGKVYKTSSSSSTAIGFTNNGTNQTLVGNKPIEITDYYTLRIFDSNNNLINEYKIDDVNPTTVGNGLSLYYSYPVFGTDDLGLQTRVTVSSTLPNGGYICNYPTHCIPMDQNGFYGEGVLELAEETELNKERFGVYTTNQAIIDVIKSGAYVTIQRDIIGEYADCNQVAGCGVPLVLEGKGVVYNDTNRHPRTMVGVKEDGTLLFVTADGRQPGSEMYGMTYDEQAALMEYYGSYEAYNLDGGGSTTMLIREGNEFRVLNSPSDGEARRDANALLVVIPDASLTVKNVTDTSMTVEMPKLGNDFNVKDYNVKVNGESYVMNPAEGVITINNLSPKTTYTIEYEYKIMYDGNERSVKGTPITVKTGNNIPLVNQYQYKIVNNNLVIVFDIIDIDNTISFATVFINGKDYDLKLDTKQLVVRNVSEFDPNSLSIVVVYQLNSTTSGTVSVTYEDVLAVDLDKVVEEPEEPEKPEQPEQPDEPEKESKCNAGAHFISIILLMSLCGILINKRK